MNEERIKEIFSDEAFVKQLLEQEEPEQVQVLLAEKEIDLSIEEIVKVQDIVEKQLNGEENLEELSDDDLENVSGGVGAAFAIGLIVAGVVGTGAFAGLMAGLRSAFRRRW